MTLPDDLYHIAEHIGDDQPNLPEGAKNTLLKAAEALRDHKEFPRPPLPPPNICSRCRLPDCKHMTESRVTRLECMVEKLWYASQEKKETA